MGGHRWYKDLKALKNGLQALRNNTPLSGEQPVMALVQIFHKISQNPKNHKPMSLPLIFRRRKKAG